MVVPPGLPEGGDIVDWIDGHGDTAEPASMKAEVEAPAAVEPHPAGRAGEPSEPGGWPDIDRPALTRAYTPQPYVLETLGGTPELRDR